MSSTNKAKGIVIAGPTGIGKTDLAILLAQRLDGELISCDSVQVFKDLQIGANKTPAPVPQHMIDVVPWNQLYTAADFYSDCVACVKDVIARGKVPILVGGTGLYMEWLLNGRPTAPPTDPAVLEEVENNLKNDKSWEESFNRLQEVDPEYAKVILPNDYYRLKRALVVHRMTRKPLSAFRTRADSDLCEVDWRCFYLTFADRVTLMRHLDHRCEGMIAKGLISEVVGLVGQGFSQNCQAGKSIGYKEVLDFLATFPTADKAIDDKILVSLIEKFQNETRKYTKRQEKWFQSMEQFNSIERPSLKEDLPNELIEKTIKWYKSSDATTQYEECAKFKRICMSERADGNARKRLREYEAVLRIYDNKKSREELLDNLRKLVSKGSSPE